MNKWGVRLIALLFIILALSAFIAACVSQETQLAPMSKATPTIAIMPTLTPTPTPTKSPLEIVSASNYMQECEDRHEKTTISQANYKDIIPGITTAEEVLLQFGTPSRIYEGMSYYGDSREAVTWEFDEYVISLRNEVVEFVFASDVKSTLNELLHQYGCPEIINHYYSYPQEYPSGGSFNYFEPVNVTRFAYPSIGLEYTFQGFPVSISQTPDYFLFFKSTTFQEYFSWGDNSNGEFIEWRDAVP